MLLMLDPARHCTTCQLQPATYGTPSTVGFHVGTFGLVGFCQQHAADYQARLGHWYEDHQPPNADPWPIRNSYLTLCQALGLPPAPWW